MAHYRPNFRAVQKQTKKAVIMAEPSYAENLESAANRQQLCTKMLLSHVNECKRSYNQAR